MQISTDSQPDVILIGANLETGNMGVNALLVSTVKCILKFNPEARISLLEGVPNPGPNEIPLSDGRIAKLGRVDIRRNKAFWRKNHLLRLFLTALFIAFIPGKKSRARLVEKNRYLRIIARSKVVADITGGDSFSDIYGLPRLIFGTMFKALVILTGQKLVLLPQTYGPFKTKAAKMMARWVLANSSAVYSRDLEGLSAIETLMANRTMKAIPSFSYDMAFVLEPMEPKTIRTLPPSRQKPEASCLVGVNVSGLLYHQDPEKKNQFGFSVDYRKLVKDIVATILKQPDTMVLFVPHVFGRADGFEDDPQACARIKSAFDGDFPQRVFLLEGRYTESELKYIIGTCDFFIGSRMHACIAAISQGIPAVPLAYSRKFLGVFESLGIGETVLDLGSADTAEVCHQVLSNLNRRGELSTILRANMPHVRDSIFNLSHSVFSIG